MSKNMCMGVSVTSLLLKTLENATKEYARECVKRCGLEYGFNVEEALLSLDLENLRVGVKEMKKRSSGKKEVKAYRENKKTMKEAVAKEVKCSVRLPFIVSEVKDSGCRGLAYNCGLFTQCPKQKMDNGSFCKTCQKEADNSSTGNPNAGIVSDRLSVGLMEYRDPKGRKVIAYSKIMAKDGVNRSKVEEEASKLNIKIPEEHFAEVVTEKAGRRKKDAKKKDIVSEASVEDLFASLLGDEEEEDLDGGDTATVIMSDSEDETENFANKKLELEQEKVSRSEMKSEDKMSKLAAEKLAKDAKALKLAQEKEEKALKLAEEKAAKEAKLAEEKSAKEAKLAEEKSAKEAKLAQEKEEKALKLAAKEAKLSAEKAAKEEKLSAEKAAKEEKLAAEKAAKEEKLAAEKAAKETKKAPKKVAEKEVKEPKKVAKVANKTPNAEEKAAPKVASETSEAPKKVTVKRITISGKQYLKTMENLLYDPETKEEVGIYDEATNTIKELPEEDDDEIEEDGYESDN